MRPDDDEDDAPAPAASNNSVLMAPISKIRVVRRCLFLFLFVFFFFFFRFRLGDAAGSGSCCATCSAGSTTAGIASGIPNNQPVWAKYPTTHFEVEWYAVDN